MSVNIKHAIILCVIAGLAVAVCGCVDENNPNASYRYSHVLSKYCDESRFMIETEYGTMLVADREKFAGIVVGENYKLYYQEEFGMFAPTVIRYEHV